MITPAMRSAVSFLSICAALSTSLAVGACTRAAPLRPVTWDAAAATTERPFVLDFENTAETYVDVYYVGEQREWWLGRVAPGALSKLRIPDAALLGTSGFVRLAVLAGTVRTAQAARDPRATFTLAQPVSSLLAQRWMFQKTQLASPQLFGQRIGAR